MRKNKVARTIQTFEWLIVAVTFIASLIAGIDTWILFPSSIVVGVFCEGIAEIIELLDKNNQKQDAIIELLKNSTDNKNTATKSVLEDIESNLPKL